MLALQLGEISVLLCVYTAFKKTLRNARDFRLEVNKAASYKNVLNAPCLQGDPRSQLLRGLPFLICAV